MAGGREGAALLGETERPASFFFDSLTFFFPAMAGAAAQQERVVGLGESEQRDLWGLDVSWRSVERFATSRARASDRASACHQR